MALGQDTRESEMDTTPIPAMQQVGVKAPVKSAPATFTSISGRIAAVVPPQVKQRGRGLVGWAQRNILLAAVAVVVLVAALGGAAYEGYKALKGTPTVSLYTVGSQQLTTYIGGGGQTYANQTVNLIFPVNARVLQVFVTVGQSVTKGQELIQLDNADLQAQLVWAQQQWQGAIHDGTAQATVDQLYAHYIAIQQQLSSSVYNNGYLVATFNGVITALNAAPGTISYQGAILISLADVSSVIVRAQFPLEQRSLITVGQSVEIDPVATTDESFNGTVTSINPQLTSAGAGTFEVWITAPNPNLQLLAGETVYARITSQAQMLAVPELSVINANADSIVFVYSHGVVHLRHVEVGAQDGDLVGIQNGLQAGDQVVLVGGYQLTDGQKVNVSSTQS